MDTRQFELYDIASSDPNTWVVMKLGSLKAELTSRLIESINWEIPDCSPSVEYGTVTPDQLKELVGSAVENMVYADMCESI